MDEARNSAAADPGCRRRGLVSTLRAKGTFVEVSSEDVSRLLADRHAGDVFVAQCKGGPTHGYGAKLRVLDAWAMRKSWSQWSTVGYEIKVSRSDFLRDTKWETYLDLCHEFYFVAPPRVIQLAELPPEIGLIETSASGTRLFTKRKAVVRKIEPPVGVMIYVLMWRATIGAEHKPDRLSYWREWLAEQEEKADLGHRVSRRLHEEFRSLRARLYNAEQDAKRDQRLTDALRTLGLDPEVATEYAIKDRLAGSDELRRRLSYHLDALRQIVGGEQL